MLQHVSRSPGGPDVFIEFSCLSWTMRLEFKVAILVHFDTDGKRIL